MKKRKYVLICFLLLFIPNLNSAKIAFKSLRDGVSNLYIMDDDGSNVQRITFTERPLWDSHPRWSPNGKRIMFMRDISKADGDQLEIFIMDSNGKHEERITHNAAFDGSATWAPDGQNITFTSDRSGSWEIYRMDILTKKVHQLTRNPGLREFAATSSWAPNGRYIAYSRVAPFRFRTIYVMGADGAKPISVNLRKGQTPQYPQAGRCDFRIAPDFVYYPQAGRCDFRIAPDFVYFGSYSQL